MNLDQLIAKLQRLKTIKGADVGAEAQVFVKDNDGELISIRTKDIDFDLDGDIVIDATYFAEE